MPLYFIERKFAEQLHLSANDVRAINAANPNKGRRWLFLVHNSRKAPHLMAFYKGPFPPTGIYWEAGTGSPKLPPRDKKLSKRENIFLPPPQKF